MIDFNENFSTSRNVFFETLRKEGINSESQKLLDDLDEIGKTSPHHFESSLNYILRDSNADNADAVALKKLIGWTNEGVSKLLPEYWNVASLLPSRHQLIEELLKRIQSFADENTDENTILDYGCGTGQIAQLVAASNSNLKIDGYDVAPNWLEHARDHLNTKLTFYDLSSSIKGHSYGFAYCYMSLHHIKDEGVAFEKIYNGLKEEGKLVIIDVIHSTSDASQRFKPHPDVKEYLRTKEDIETSLNSAGFIVQESHLIDESILCIEAVKQQLNAWESFAEKENSNLNVTKTLNTASSPNGLKNELPFQFTLTVMSALMVDLVGVNVDTSHDPWIDEQGKLRPRPKTPPSTKSNSFFEAIGFFTWEPNSNQFLVRRFWPTEFKGIPYSSVATPWGVLGKMLEDLKSLQSLSNYLGYSYLDKGAVQRTLPFRRDIRDSKYEAALALPVFDKPAYSDSDNKCDAESYKKLVGAYVIYLKKLTDVPKTHEHQLVQNISKKFKSIANLTSKALKNSGVDHVDENHEPELAESWSESSDAHYLKVTINLLETVKKNQAISIIESLREAIAQPHQFPICATKFTEDHYENLVIYIAGSEEFPTEIMQNNVATSITIAMLDFSDIKYNITYEWQGKAVNGNKAAT